jgi:uncharacterized repeat protein (TIGR01451 family)
MKATQANRRYKPLLLGLVLVLVAGVGWFAGGAAPAAAESTADISSAGPLTHVYVGAQLGCQVAHTLDGSTLEFFESSSIPGDCGTFVFVDGTMFAPDVGSHSTATGALGAYTAFTPVSQTAVTGLGTSVSPFQVITVVDAGATGIQVTQTDSYVVGQESYLSDISVSNTSGGSKSVLVYHAADCYLGSSDSGYGYANAGTKTVACTKNANNTPADRIEQFSPITPADHFYEASYSSVWAALGTHTNLPDTCDCSTLEDNGIAINWDRTILSGDSVTFSQLTTFSPLGSQPIVVSKTADAGTSAAGGANGYTITITNPNAAAVTVNTIQDTLPAGFSYVPGSTTGVTTSDPGIVGQVLTWTGPYPLADSSSLSLHFNVTVGSTAGTYFNDATATATVDVVPTGPTAPIVVTTRIWGDVDCSGDIAPRDAQAILKNVLVQNPLSQTQPCPAVGAQVMVDGVSRIWGDIDCSGDIAPRDAQAILKNVLVQNPLSQTQPCPAVGSTVHVIG